MDISAIFRAIWLNAACRHRVTRTDGTGSSVGRHLTEEFLNCYAFVHSHNQCVEHGVIFCVCSWVNQQGILNNESIRKKQLAMWCHPSPEFKFMAQGSTSIVSEKAAWLSPNILILLILLRIQRCKRPWTRAEFYCPSHPKEDIFSFGYCYGLEQNCFLQAHVFECLSLGWDYCFWKTWSHSTRGLPARDGHCVWAFENTAQAWFPSGFLGFQAQRPPEASLHSPAASNQASPSATSSSPEWTVFPESQG